jgi:hypothetical protein
VQDLLGSGRTLPSTGEGGSHGGFYTEEGHALCSDSYSQALQATGGAGQAGKRGLRVREEDRESGQFPPVCPMLVGSPAPPMYASIPGLHTENAECWAGL